MSATVEIKFPREAEEAIRRLGDQGGMLRAVAKELDLQNDYTISHIQEKRLNFPRHEPPVREGLRHITGNLQRSLRRNTATVSGNSVSGSIGTHVKYAGIHEFGGETKPRVIVAKNKQALSFLVGGRRVTVKKVNHPGSKYPARAFIRNGIRDRSEEIGEALGQAALAFYRGKGLL